MNFTGIVLLTIFYNIVVTACIGIYVKRIVKRIFKEYEI